MSPSVLQPIRGRYFFQGFFHGVSADGTPVLLQSRKIMKTKENTANEPVLQSASDAGGPASPTQGTDQPFGVDRPNREQIRVVEGQKQLVLVNVKEVLVRCDQQRNSGQ